MNTLELRLKKANELIKTIASCGRKFFSVEITVSPTKEMVTERISKFKYLNNRLYFWDKYSAQLLPCWKQRDNWRYQSKKWHRFTEGGTLKDLIEDLSTYIYTGKELPNHFRSLPEWYSHGEDNYWGYPKEDMDKIRKFYKENFNED